MKTDRDLQAWMEKAQYLPPELRDFHDQKDLFKAVHEIISENDGTKAITWRDAHIYTIDVFLWFMARRGYTLQRSRARMPFVSLADTLKAWAEERTARIVAALKGGTP
jgi:hypothetical protein